MMAAFGWTDPKMPAHDNIAQANREKLGMSGMEKIVAFDQSQSLDEFLQLPDVDSTRTLAGDGVVTFPDSIRNTMWSMVRSEGHRICYGINRLERSIKP